MLDALELCGLYPRYIGPERDQIFFIYAIGQCLPYPERTSKALARGLLTYAVFCVTGACSYTRIARVRFARITYLVC
jgi:hypothetical protein